MALINQLHHLGKGKKYHILPDKSLNHLCSTGAYPVSGPVGSYNEDLSTSSLHIRRQVHQEHQLIEQRNEAPRIKELTQAQPVQMTESESTLCLSDFKPRAPDNYHPLTNASATPNDVHPSLLLTILLQLSYLILVTPSFKCYSPFQVLKPACNGLEIQGQTLPKGQNIDLDVL